jgi:hypothetical protein
MGRIGHAPDVLTVGVRALGFVGDTDDAAKDAFFPGWAYMFTEIGRERGWSTATRPQFEAMCSSRGTFLIGSPKTVRDKILDANTALGGVSRITFQMSSAMLETEAIPTCCNASSPARRSMRQNATRSFPTAPKAISTTLFWSKYDEPRSSHPCLRRPPEAVSIDQVKAASTEASGRTSLKVRTRAQCGKILRAMVGAAPA